MLHVVILLITIPKPYWYVTYQQILEVSTNTLYQKTHYPSTVTQQESPWITESWIFTQNYNHKHIYDNIIILTFISRLQYRNLTYQQILEVSTNTLYQTKHTIHQQSYSKNLPESQNHESPPNIMSINTLMKTVLYLHLSLGYSLSHLEQSKLACCYTFDIN